MATIGSLSSNNNFDFTWKVENFLGRPEKQNERILSPSFTIIDNNGRHGTIHLTLYPKGCQKSIANQVAAFVNNKTHEELNLKFRWVTIFCKLFFINFFYIGRTYLLSLYILSLKQWRKSYTTQITNSYQN